MFITIFKSDDNGQRFVLLTCSMKEQYCGEYHLSTGHFDITIDVIVSTLCFGANWASVDWVICIIIISTFA